MTSASEDKPQKIDSDTATPHAGAKPHTKQLSKNTSNKSNKLDVSKPLAERASKDAFADPLTRRGTDDRVTDGANRHDSAEKEGAEPDVEASTDAIVAPSEQDGLDPTALKADASKDEQDDPETTRQDTDVRENIVVQADAVEREDTVAQADPVEREDTVAQADPVVRDDTVVQDDAVVQTEDTVAQADTVAHNDTVVKDDAVKDDAVIQAEDIVTQNTSAQNTVVQEGVEAAEDVERGVTGETDIPATVSNDSVADGANAAGVDPDAVDEDPGEPFHLIMLSVLLHAGVVTAITFVLVLIISIIAPEGS